MSNWIWWGLGGAILAGGTIWWRSRRGAPGFRDVLRNPWVLEKFGALIEERGTRARALDGKPAEIADLVDQVVFGAKTQDAAWEDLAVLGQLGSQSLPRILAILQDRDAGTRKKLFQSRERSWRIESPLGRLCELLERIEPEPVEAAIPLAALFESSPRELRGDVLRCLARMSANATYPILFAGLRNSETAGETVAGLEGAAVGGRVPQSRHDALFEHLGAAIGSSDSELDACSATKVLLQIDPRRAERLLLEPRRFEQDICDLRAPLQACNELAKLVPRDFLLGALARLDSSSDVVGARRARREALIALGRHRHGDDRKQLESLLENGDSEVRAAAAKALELWHDVARRFGDPWERYEKVGHDLRKVAEIDQHLLAVRFLDGEICNGGFSQYWLNPSGDDWKIARSGLEAMGLQELHAVLDAACGKFGPEGPATDQKSRWEQLSALSQGKEDVFDECNGAWCSSSYGRLEVAEALHKIKQLES